MDKLNRANELKHQIKELDYFLLTIEPWYNIKRGSGKYDINSVIKTKTLKSFSIFASRWFGCGTHESEIRIPNTLIDQLYSLAKIQKDQLEKELNKLVPNYDAKIV